MPWKQLSAAKWQRPVGENETFIKLVGDPGHALGREHWAIDSIIRIQPLGQLAEADLSTLFRKTWKAFRFEQPSIAAYAETDNETLTYDVPNEAALEAWADETFSIVTDKSAEELIPSLKNERYITLTWLPKTHELLSHTAHWRTDGIGILMLFDAFLNLATKPDLPDPSRLKWGEEPSRLVPPVEEAGQMPETPSEEEKSLGQKCMETFYAAAGAVGITFLGGTQTVPAGTRSARLQFSEEQTRQIVENCKAKDVSVTAAVHASVAEANYSHAAAENKAKHYTSTIRIGFRPYLPEKFRQNEYASGLYTTGYMHRSEPGTGWSNRAKQYQAAYKDGLSREYVRAHREYALRLGDLIRNMPAGGEPPSEVDISSIGVAERYIGREKGSSSNGIRVEKISLGVELLTRQCVCFVWTFRGQLELNVVYNESFHAPKEMDSFARTVRNSLLRELNVEI